MDDLVKMIGPNGPEDIAIVRPDWVDQWRAYGYATEEEIATKAAAAEAAAKAAADKAAAEAAAKAAAGKKD